ncbi:NAD(P)H-dependent oxidoreductase, partial [Maribacter sp.]|uniref:NADPH-dependent FMN reductase n=1 Tax=Maribacter sp. TaxID=1897614 RepID=UPI0025B94ED3
MASILAFAGSNSSVSINYKLVKHTVSLAKEHSVQLLNLANCPFPMYSEDYEKENGYSNSLVEFKDDIQKSDGVIISVNEHNG